LRWLDIDPCVRYQASGSSVSVASHELPPLLPGAPAHQAPSQATAGQAERPPPSKLRQALLALCASPASCACPGEEGWAGTAVHGYAKKQHNAAPCQSLRTQPIEQFPALGEPVSAPASAGANPSSAQAAVHRASCSEDPAALPWPATKLGPNAPRCSSAFGCSVGQRDTYSSVEREAAGKWFLWFALMCHFLVKCAGRVRPEDIARQTAAT